MPPVAQPPSFLSGEAITFFLFGHSNVIILLDTAPLPYLLWNRIERTNETHLFTEQNPHTHPQHFRAQ